MATSKPKRVKKNDITLQLQTGTDSTILAQWKWKRTHTAMYKVEWEYLVAEGIWFKGKEEDIKAPNTSGGDYHDTYDYPEIATQIRFRIKPISQKYETNENPNEEAIVTEDPNSLDVVARPKAQVKIVSTGGRVDYWRAEWSAYKLFKIKPDITPETPSAPNIEIEGNVITLRSETYDPNATHLRFQIYKNDSVQVDLSALIKVVTNVASYSKTIDFGNRYKARVQAYNSKDKSYSEWSNWTSEVKTAPDAVNSEFLGVYAVSSTSAKLIWDAIGQNVTGYTIEYATNPEYFDQSSSVQSTSVGAVNPYAIIEGLETGKRWYFRIRATNDQGESAWSQVVNCLLGTTPTAPTVWSSTSTAVYGETVTLYWVHNSEDGSRETSAVLKIYNPGSREPVTKEIAKTDDSNISRYEYEVTDASLEGEVRWSVSTKGVMPSYGPFSETATFKILVQPTLGIVVYKKKEWMWDPFNFETDTIYTANGVFTEPYSLTDLTVTQYPMFVVVTMSPLSQTPIECNFSIYATTSYQTLNHVGADVWVNAGDQLFSRTIPYIEPSNSSAISQNQFELILTPGDVILENYMTYTLVCTVVSNNGLTAEGTITFTIEIDEDVFIPDAEIGIDGTSIIAYVKPAAYDETGNLLGGIRMSVYRIQFDGELQKVGSEVDSSSNTMIVDPHPNLNYARYRIVGYSGETGQYNYYDIPGYPVSIPEVIIQWDEQWRSYESVSEDEVANPIWNGTMLRFPYNIDTSESSAIDVELVEYIGRDHPVSYYGTQVGQTMTLSSDIAKDDEDMIFALRRLMRYMGDVYVREPNGAGYWAQISVSFSTTHNEVTIPVSISVTRVEGGE